MTDSRQPELTAAVFDLDGLLIDSEPLWQIAEVEVLGALGVPLTGELCRQTVGLRIEDAVGYWWAHYPWAEPGVNQVADQVVARMLELIAERGRPMPGAVAAVKALHQRRIPLAVATSSRRELAAAALQRLGLADLIQSVSSAEDQEYGKPHPAVYLEAAHALGVAPERCMAFEDSVTGVISAKAARMQCTAVPFHEWGDDLRLALADLRLDSLAEVDERWIATVFADGTRVTNPVAEPTE